MAVRHEFAQPVRHQYTNYDMRKLFRAASLTVATALLCLGAYALPASATSTDSASSGIAQSYGTDPTVRQGMIVGLNQRDTTKVEPLSSGNETDMFGVVISASAAPITLSGGAATAQVYVATSGQYAVLVSNQNGAIRIGDYIAMSGLNGIGMKAQDSESTVLGKAVTSFSGNGTNGTSTATVHHGATTSTVVIGTVTVSIAVANNPNQGKGTGNLPGFLAIASSSIADKPVSAPRVYLSIAVLVLTAFIAGSLLYSGVRNGIVSIGRNPLAKRYILRSLLQVILVSLIVFIIGLFAVYLLLRL